MTEFQTFLQAANTLGTVGVLLFLVWAFYKGELVSKTTHDHLLKAQQEQAERLITLNKDHSLQLVSAHKDQLEIMTRIYGQQMTFLTDQVLKRMDEMIKRNGTGPLGGQK